MISGNYFARNAVIGIAAVAIITLGTIMSGIQGNRYDRFPAISWSLPTRTTSVRTNNPYELAKNFEKVFISKDDDCTYLEFSNRSGTRTVEAMFEGNDGIRAEDYDGDGSLDLILYFPKARFDWKGENLIADKGQRKIKIKPSDAAVNEIARVALEKARNAFEEGDEKARDYGWYGDRIK